MNDHWTQFDKNLSRKSQFAVYFSRCCCDLETGNGNAWHENVKPSGGFHHAKFQRSPLKQSLRKKNTIKVFYPVQQRANYFPWNEYTIKSRKALCGKDHDRWWHKVSIWSDRKDFKKIQLVVLIFLIPMLPWHVVKVIETLWKCKAQVNGAYRHAHFERGSR